MKSIIVNGSEKTVFVEGVGFKVIYSNKNELLSNNTSNSFTFKRKGNEINIKLVFSKKKDLIQNKTYITKNQKNDFLKQVGEKDKVSAFKDQDKDLVLADAKIKDNIRISKSFGKNEFFLSEDINYFRDRAKETILELLEDSQTNPQLDYPFSFNYNNFFNRGFRIDAFSNIEKIKRTHTSIDELKGIRENSFMFGKNAFKKNITIKDYKRKNEDVVSHYEDDIDQYYLYHDTDRFVKEISGRIRNPQTGVETVTISSKSKVIYSNDARYFVNKEVKIKPFIDKSFNANNFELNANEQVYKASDNDINEELLNNRNINNAIIEDKVYYSRGRDLDKSKNFGLESISFYEGLN